MSSMSSVAGLSKFIKTLPKTSTSMILIAILSFLAGIIYFLIDPKNSLTYNI